jgi:Mn2+/Fe2+ NRAMP family transporter
MRWRWRWPSSPRQGRHQSLLVLPASLAGGKRRAGYAKGESRCGARQQGPAALRRINLDNDIGMSFSEIAAFFIILTAAVVLHARSKTDIQTTSDAAAALRPLAGAFAFGQFAAGIAGTGLLALPVQAGSAAYALGETYRWD